MAKVLIMDATRSECIEAIRKNKMKKSTYGSGDYPLHECGSDMGYYVQIQEPGGLEKRLIGESRVSTKTYSYAWGRIWYKGSYLTQFTGPINVVRQELVKYLQQLTTDSHPLKTYKIKNHDSGKTFSVKAVNYTDAKMKYNKHILEDALSLVEKIGDYTIKKNNDGSYLKFEVFYKGKRFAIAATVDAAKNEIESHKRYAQFKDSIKEDADKSMGTYNGYSIKQNVDGNIYVLKKSGEKQFFESWKKAHEAIKTGAIKDSITEDDDAFIKETIAELSRYIRNWDYMSTKERNNIMPGYSKSEGLAALKTKLTEAKAKLKKDITEDADIAQNDIKSSYLPEDANADNIQYLGFNEKRKLSFYGYGDRYFVHYDLEGRTEEVDKSTVQKILKKNILGEIDENDLINKEPQAEEIVSDAFEEDVADIALQLTEMMDEYGYSRNQFQKFLKSVYLKKFTEKQFREFGIEGRQEVIDYAKAVKAWTFDSFEEDAGEISIEQFDPKRLVESSKSRKQALHNEIKMKNGDIYTVFFQASGEIENPRSIWVSIVLEKSNGQQESVLTEKTNSYEQAIQVMTDWKKKQERGDK